MTRDTSKTKALVQTGISEGGYTDMRDWRIENEWRRELDSVGACFYFSSLLGVCPKKAPLWRALK